MTRRLLCANLIGNRVPYQSARSLNVSTPLLSSECSLQYPYEPWNNHLLEDQRVGPDFGLTAEVATFGIDPCGLGHVAFRQQQVEIVNRHLRVEHASEDEHRAHRLAEQAIVHQRQLGEQRGHLIKVRDTIENRYHRRHLVEKILSVTLQ